MVNKDFELINQHRRDLLQVTLIGAVVLVVAAAGTYFGLDLVYAQRALPGVKFLDINLGGKTRGEILSLLEARVGDAKLTSLQFEFEGRLWEIDPNEFNFQVEASVLTDKALQIGRQGNLIQKIGERFYAATRTNQSVVNGFDLVHSFDRARLEQYLASIAETINQPRQSAVLVIQDDRATQFTPPQDGYELDVDRTIVLVAQNILNPGSPIELPVKITPVQISLAQTNTLGIDTLIARGISDFSGSPPNRRHNIGVGAARFDGVLVKPDEVFSFLQALGEVSASTGYRPELVIKEDATIPEYGGGLCQVSTTAFRAILNGGFPVVARRNHSYRVVYYEPAGTDATIYQPYPDLKFKNDTPGYVLMDTYVVGNKLYFDFYGTDTGRRVELDGPYIYNTTGYPEPIYIDTSTIPVGEIQQVDSAHRGADTVVYSKIYQDGKLIRTDTFRSHYIPWPAKYLRGVEEAAEVEADLENVLPEDAASEDPLVDPLNPPAEGEI